LMEEEVTFGRIRIGGQPVSKKITKRCWISIMTKSFQEVMHHVMLTIPEFRFRESFKGLWPQESVWLCSQFRPRQNVLSIGFGLLWVPQLQA
jgi:hypothetical protein